MAHEEALQAQQAAADSDLEAMIEKMESLGKSQDDISGHLERERERRAELEEKLQQSEVALKELDAALRKSGLKVRRVAERAGGLKGG